MLSQELVLVFLQAGITGAGLVLAIYALIIPFSKKVLQSNLIYFLGTTKFENRLLSKLFRNEQDKEGREKTQKALTKVIESISFPTYLRIGVGATFLGYTITTLASLAWLIDWQKSVMNLILVPLFGISTVVFLFVGLISIKDIHSTMREDFNQMIKNLKENEDKAKNEL